MDTNNLKYYSNPSTNKSYRRTLQQRVTLYPIHAY